MNNVPEPAGDAPAPQRSPISSHATLAAELRSELARTFALWVPRTLDQAHGGYLCNFNYRWKPHGPQKKMLEYQARMTRLLARAALEGGFAECRDYARHGFEYLRDVMWDAPHGGWFRMLDRAGNPQEAHTKHGHGASYAIAACAVYYELTGDPQALELAQNGFRWLERVGHDSAHGGYFALYTREGQPVLSAETCPIPGLRRDCIGTPLGFKDANTNGDMLDTLVDLYRVWPDPLVEQRLVEMFHIMRDRIFVPPGAVHMYFHPDWTPVPDFARYSYGLNLVNIAARALRSPALAGDAKMASMIKATVDTQLTYGWDPKNGGFYYGGSTFGLTLIEDIEVLIRDKFWWPQAEGLRALLRLALLHPDDPADYRARFEQLWAYIQRYILDHRHGGWLGVGRDCRPRRYARPKATPWKEPSHEVHSLLDCLLLLRAAAAGVPVE